MSLELIMGYYHINIFHYCSEISNKVFPWGHKQTIINFP